MAKDGNCPNVKVPDGSFAAHGYRGHQVFVIPQWDLVIVHRVDTFKREGSVGSSDFGKLLRLILAARTKAD